MQNTNQARHLIDGVSVFCAFDEIAEITDLKENPRNPNTHPKEQIELLAEIIKKTGWRAPITVSNLSGFIVKGHGRLQAAKKAGFKNVPVEYQNFNDEEEELAALLADNKIAELAEIDTEKLTELFKDVDFDDLSLTGYSQNEYEDLIEDFEEVDLLDDSVEVDEEGELFTQSGDIWQLGKHRLICGDSTVLNVYETLMGDELADLLLTDPPYNVNYEGGTGLKIQNDNMEDAAFRQFLIDAFNACDSVMKEGAGFYIWHSDTERYNFQGACNDVDWQVRQCLVWVKNQLVMGRQDYQWKHEPCLYGWKAGAAHYFIDDRTQVTVFDDKLDLSKMKREELEELLKSVFADKTPTTVLYYDKPLRNDEHPTMKPIALFAQLIQNSSVKGAIVLDAFGGSGTTLIACEQLGRIARLIELDGRYCDAIVKRFMKLFPSEEVQCIRGGEAISWSFD